MRISDWSSDVCSSDLVELVVVQRRKRGVAVADSVHLMPGAAEGARQEGAEGVVVFGEEDACHALMVCRMRDARPLRRRLKPVDLAKMTTSSSTGGRRSEVSRSEAEYGL